MMKSVLTYLRGLVGNGWQAAVGIFLFILILVILSTRCSKASGAEIDLRAGSSFGPGRSGPVLGLNLYQPISNDVYLYGGTLLWGRTSRVENNWDWHGGFRACRWDFCASLGASYLQRIDAVNGAHTNYNLELAYRFSWWRLASIDIAHLSDAGTTPINLGRNAALLSFRLQ